ncbi:hypothetical protein [Micromonospora sp. KC723]|uniref:hypothetical protein n=1 Tax=Micromonospora sp. KC723 TaxID=2530381 RepID=UPI001049A329|nr:hypothetical protein E1165_14825 [Micromonospora sp. KC723]
MRFVRAFAGMLLLVLGIPVLLAGVGLTAVAGRAAADGAFTARFEPLRTTGRAVLVADVDALLRTEAPFARVGPSRLRLTARTADGPAFAGLAPAEEVRRWLEPVPHATVDRVALARGPLPVRLTDAASAPTARPGGVVPAAPREARFWVREGVGAVEWSPAEWAGRRLSLVVMRPDGAADLAVDVRAELRVDWFRPVAWGLLAGGLVLVGLAMPVLLRPPRPREVVFVVEPDQVPVLAGRLGVSSLSGLGAPRRPEPERELVGIGTADGARPAIGAGPARRPATLADLPPWPPERSGGTPGATDRG